MLSLRKPSPEQIRRFLDAQGEQALTYSAIGATSRQPPPGYTVDHTRINLGTGEATYQAARTALQGWRQFELGWLEAWPAEPSLKPGGHVAILARAMGLWWLNACRIVYVVDAVGPVWQFGFAYGTLPTHVGTGEERFLIEWDRQDDTVWFDILAFSRLQHPLVRLGYPMVRRTQKQFGREATAAMLRAVTATR